MARCKHCGQMVEDYVAHFPTCPTIRAIFDDTYWPGWLDHHRLLPDAKHAARRAARARRKPTARPLLKFKEKHMPLLEGVDPHPETQGAAHIRNSQNFTGAYPNPKQIDGELVIDVPPFKPGDNVPAVAAQKPDPMQPRAQGPAEPRAAGAQA